MPTEADFLEDIDADPDADAPRLGHAYWLEASDPARSEFISPQVRITRLPFRGEYEAHNRAEELLTPLTAQRVAVVSPRHR